MDEFTKNVIKLRTHINDKFNINMTEFETRLSIQRIKNWYCRTLKQRSKAQKLGKHFDSPFPHYFDIMDKFLSFDVNYSKDLVLGRCFQRKNSELKRYPTWMVCKQASEALKIDKRNFVDEIKSEKELEFGDEDDVQSDSDGEQQKKHAQTDSPPEPLICDICFVDFRQRQDLKRHRVIHFPPKYPCSTCSRMHYTRLMATKCLHEDKVRKRIRKRQSYVCEICGFSFRSVGFLNYHKKDKHFNQRFKCGICPYSTIIKHCFQEHLEKRHVVEFGTCEEIARRTRPRNITRVPYTLEARREYLWLQEMKKGQKPGEFFHGCFKCKLVFRSRREKLQHNKKEHPVTATTVLCQLCPENALFSGVNSVRRHYTDIHRVPWNEIDELMNRTKPLMQLLTQEEIDILNSCENPNFVLAKILANKTRTLLPKNADGFCEDIIADVETGYTRKIVYQRSTAHYDDDDSNDDEDLDQSTLYNDFEIDPDNDEDDDYQYGDLDDINLDRFNVIKDETGADYYVIEDAYVNDFLALDLENPIGFTTDVHNLIYDATVHTDDEIKEEEEDEAREDDPIIEDIIEEVFNDDDEAAIMDEVI